MSVNEREIYWIKYYKTQGCKLLNISAISPNAKCQEYHTYLKSIQTGSTSWHYYYCGRTAGGIEVYDKERLEADGFTFPERLCYHLPDSSQEEGYNPWNNERFLKKIDYRRSYEDKMSYVPCYRDTDPNYYDSDY